MKPGYPTQEHIYSLTSKYDIWSWVCNVLLKQALILTNPETHGQIPCKEDFKWMSCTVCMCVLIKPFWPISVSSTSASRPRICPCSCWANPTGGLELVAWLECRQTHVQECEKHLDMNPDELKADVGANVDRIARKELQKFVESVKKRKQAPGPEQLPSKWQQVFMVYM